MEQMNKLSSEMVEILRKKKQHLLGILNYTQLQTNAIEDQDDERLNQYTDGKQSLIDKIDELDGLFVKKFDDLKNGLGIESLDQATGIGLEPLKQVRFELDGIYMLTEQIFHIEKENSVKVKKEFDDIKDKLKEISGGKKLSSAYGVKPDANGGALFDTKK